MKLTGKIGIITGSSRGIGKATAIACCKAGARVILNGRNKERLEETRRELEKMGFEVDAFQGDVTNVSDCNRMIVQALTHCGRIDFLIANASITQNASLDSLQPFVFMEVAGSNLNSVAVPALAVLPYIKPVKGSILFISSLAGLHGMPNAAAYSAGKMGLTALWQSFKIETAGTGVHVGICYLGFTQNDAEKRMLAGDGNWVEVPGRPAWMQKTQGQVAHQILKQLVRRKSRKVISFTGKLIAFVFRYFPRLTLFLMMKTYKKQRTQ